MTTGTAKPKPDGKPSPVPRSRTFRLAQRTWWLPWVLGAAAVAVAVVITTEVFTPDQPAGWDQVRLPTAEHQVVYTVTGSGKSPEIKYVVDGVNGTETVVNGDLPWRKEFTLKVGPGLGVVQVLAANNESAGSIACTVSVDGNVVHQATSRGPGTQVSCSSVIRPSSR
ncbi:membrane protein [Amycolatopsis tolypomycina]|uniref:Membrane protein n=1 Tax=Amycolatopsis tolypomycina TaxID=208445 RepID=A0A1H4YWP1_9PSEU|nr:MmpS family transport accessory protein [Amycolatopsis tolypomycina]SED22025.1 membrane protein [Amycolatopsis tolypomycina]